MPFYDLKKKPISIKNHKTQRLSFSCPIAFAPFAKAESFCFCRLLELLGWEGGKKRDLKSLMTIFIVKAFYEITNGLLNLLELSLKLELWPN